MRFERVAISDRLIAPHGGAAAITFDPYKLDFQALRTLKLVHLHRSFSEVALRLGVSQSVVSYTIDKIRSAVGDPLFIRQAGTVVPTDECTAIVAAAERILELYDSLLTPEDIAPQDIRQRFTLSGNFYERRWILPPVARMLRQRAPQAELVVIQAQTNGPKQLLNGEADILIGPMRPEAEGFYHRNLISEDYVCIMDPGNPLAHHPLTLKGYAAASHIAIDYGRGWVSGYVHQAKSRGLDLRSAITVPSPSGIADLISGTDLVATVPEQFARSLGQQVHIAPCPFPAPFDIGLVWTARTHGSRLHRWLRNLMFDAVRDSFGQAPKAPDSAHTCPSGEPDALAPQA